MNKSHMRSIVFDECIPIKEEILLKSINNRINGNNNENNKEKKNKICKIKKFLLVGVFLLFLFVFIGSLFKAFNWYQDNQNTNKITKEIENVVEVEEVTDDEAIELVNEPEKEVESDYWYYIKFPLIQVDFNELMKKNSDTVAWIQVNNTNINYPVVQSNDNDYYLKRSYDKSWNDAGWVFMDYRNSGNLNDRNTIIYAHSRLDKTMFGSLSKVLKNNWYKNKDNHIIKMSTPSENSLWQIFSVYKIEAENYYITTDFSNDNDYIDFLNTLEARSRYDFDVTLSSDDSIITLSTCYSDTERTVVHAKKIKKSIRNS